MARVSVLPEEFTIVNYDPKRLVALAEEMAAHAGLGDDVDVTIEVDERSPFGHTVTTVEGTKVHVSAESAAFEDAKNLREMSEEGSRQVLGRLFFRVSDRFNEAFGDPPADPDLTYEQQSAWDAYSMGRVERTGVPGNKPRRRYQFRLRHGFTDVADQVFDRLWGADDLAWADIDAACAETTTVRPERAKKGERQRARR